ncbi:MAG: LysE family translocator [Flavobacteriaceae bacterium]
MLNIEVLISFIIATATLAFSPGPDNIFVLIQSATYGKKYGFAVVCGLMSGCLVHTSLVAFGLSAFIQANEKLYWILKVFGAAYMLFLAFKVYKSKQNLSPLTTEVSQKKIIQLFKQGFIMNVLNPKVSIFFLAFFPAFIFSDSMALFKQFYVLGFLFIITSFVVFSSFVILSGFFSKLFLDSPKKIKLLKRLQVGFFIGIAVLILRG